MAASNQARSHARHLRAKCEKNSAWASTSSGSSYGGSALENVYLNGDRVGYVTVAYLCTLHASSFTLDDHEVLETRWVTLAELARLDHHEWIGQVLADAVR